MPRIAVQSGLHFYYQQKGAGPDVVLIHGITGNMAIWPLINLIDNLAADFRVTYYDLRGHGYSDTPPDHYTSADMADDLRSLQKALGLGPSYLVGHSFGAVVAMQTAVRHRDHVLGAVLSDVYFPALHHLEGNIAQWDGWEAYVKQSAEAGMEVAPENWSDVGHILQQAAGLPPERREKFVKAMGEPALQRLVRLAQTTCGQECGQVAGLTPERICSVRQPVLAMFGEDSPFLATCRYLVENLPNCRSALVPGASHLAHEESPEQFVEIVEKHLRQMAGIDGTWSAGWSEPAGRNA